METLSTLVNGLSKSYLYTSALRDILRFVRRNLSDVDFDADSLLHRAGLARHRPAAAAGGGVALLVAGAIAGAGAALLLAPSTGKKLRSQVKDSAKAWFEAPEEKVERASSRSAS